MHHYPLGGMEDVLRTALATYMPQRTGEGDERRIRDFADKVRDIIYRMGCEERPGAYDLPQGRGARQEREAIMEALCSSHPANIIDESDIEYREALYERLRRLG